MKIRIAGLSLMLGTILVTTCLRAQAQAPSITSLSLTQGPSQMGFVINGANFGGAQGTSTVTLNGTQLTVISWSGTSITVQVPAGATSGNVVVTVSGLASNAEGFTVTGTVGCG